MAIAYSPTHTAYYRCIRRHDSGASTCTSGYINAVALEREVLDRVRTDVQNALQFEELEIPEASTEKLDSQIKAVHSDIEQQLRKSHAQFDQFTDGRLLDEQYSSMNRMIQQRLQTLQKTRDSLQRELEQGRERIDQTEFVRKGMMQFLQVDTENVPLTREMLRIFVDFVTVFQRQKGNKEVKIRYRFAQPS